MNRLICALLGHVSSDASYCCARCGTTRYSITNWRSPVDMLFDWCMRLRKLITEDGDLYAWVVLADVQMRMDFFSVGTHWVKRPHPLSQEYVVYVGPEFPKPGYAERNRQINEWAKLTAQPSQSQEGPSPQRPGATTTRPEEATQ
jgi:hypothetical protein